MTNARRTAAGEALTELILEAFRFNGRVLTAGDRLVGQLRLTSSRWQVMGAIAYSPVPETVARLARNMGAHRQGVQRIVNDLVENGLAEFQPNPHHRRANLVVLTSQGRDIFDQAMKLQVPWANALSKGIAAEDIVLATRVLRDLRRRLERERTSEPRHQFEDVVADR
jgi:DNA-binding MarR family transcriptional regulator